MGAAFRSRAGHYGDFALRFLAFFAASLLATSASAIELELPLDCHIGVDCFVQNYVDVDPTPAWKDFACGNLTYEKHDGTDFRLKNFVEMEKGVSVLAVADGVVKGMRDGVPDIGSTKPEVVQNKECGNGVLIDHADGWQTQYCHMKKGSLRVFKGQRVKTGDVLGQVGYSGQTEFPHLHLTVRHNGKVVDPFTNQPVGNGVCNANPEGSIWDPKAGIHYIPTALLGAGFTTQTPEFDGVRHGKFSETSMAKDATSLILWADVMGIQEGDVLQFRMATPQGAVFLSKDQVFANRKVLQFQFVGRGREGAIWLPGTYTGRVILMRKGQQVFQQALTIKVQE